MVCLETERAETGDGPPVATGIVSLAIVGGSAKAVVGPWLKSGWVKWVLTMFTTMSYGGGRVEECSDPEGFDKFWSGDCVELIGNISFRKEGEEKALFAGVWVGAEVWLGTSAVRVARARRASPTAVAGVVAAFAGVMDMFPLEWGPVMPILLLKAAVNWTEPMVCGGGTAWLVVA